jgi:hypothetical protein
LASGLAAVVTVAVERQFGHAGGVVSVPDDRDGIDVSSFTQPPEKCFDEGWRPRWPQGSGKRRRQYTFSIPLSLEIEFVSGKERLQSSGHACVPPLAV